VEDGGPSGLERGKAAGDGGFDGIGVAHQLAMCAGGFGDLGEIHAGRERRTELVFAPRVPVERHVARVAAADLVVDSFPYGAHTTANDALLAGVPLVTRAGETLVSRIAGSQLHAIGVPELVTSDPGAYEAIARRLAQSPAELARFRARIAANRASFPLFDTARFTRDVEAALLRAWAAIGGN